MKKTLAILIAKSGVALLDLLPKEWEVVISDHSRLDQRGVEFWNTPLHASYDEIVIVDRNVTTALTQRKIAEAVSARGIRGPIKFAGSIETKLAYRHQDFVLGKEGLFAKTLPDLDPDPYKIDRYMIALVGLPASGKSMLRKLLAGLPGFSTYKWGGFAQAAIVDAYGPMTEENSWTLVQRFTEEIESKDKIAIARKFVETSSIGEDTETFAIVDGIKRREQIIYASYATHRPVIVVRVLRDESERQSEARKRGDFDDWQDSARTELLRGMGAIDVMDFADFVIKTDGNSIDYDKTARTCKATFSTLFAETLHEVLDWLFVSSSLDETRSLIERECKRIGTEAGYTTEVTV